MNTQELTHRIEFESGMSHYAEGLLGGQWVGICRRIKGQQHACAGLTPLPAFDLEISTSPEAETPLSLTTGWQWIASEQIATADREHQHQVIELSSALVPLTVKVHTLTDGTSVLVRYLQITNTTSAPMAITAVAPWSGRLWHQPATVSAGYSIFKDGQQTGSFGWRPLATGVTAIKNLREPCYDDPFFILQNSDNNEFFFGQLAWPSLYALEFSHTDEGVSFRIGPQAREGVLRVMAPGETVETPAVHLCHIQGDFNAVVQEMHAHVRRSVLLDNKPELSHRIEYIANGDTGTCLYKGDAFNERNLRPCVDVAAEIGAETFLIDGPFWAEGIESNVFSGGTTPDNFQWDHARSDLFPSGMSAFRNHVHAQGLLFGLYCRTEGKHMLTSGAPGMHGLIARVIEAFGIDLYRHDTSCEQFVDWVHTLQRNGFDVATLTIGEQESELVVFTHEED